MDLDSPFPLATFAIYKRNVRWADSRRSYLISGNLVHRDSKHAEVTKDRLSGKWIRGSILGWNLENYA